MESLAAMFQPFNFFDFFKGAGDIKQIKYLLWPYLWNLTKANYLQESKSQKIWQMQDMGENENFLIKVWKGKDKAKKISERELWKVRKNYQKR